LRYAHLATLYRWYCRRGGIIKDGLMREHASESKDLLGGWR
jgi:hypothetical protein